MLKALNYCLGIVQIVGDGQLDFFAVNIAAPFPARVKCDQTKDCIGSFDVCDCSLILVLPIS